MTGKAVGPKICPGVRGGGGEDERLQTALPTEVAEDWIRSVADGQHLGSPHRIHVPPLVCTVHSSGKGLWAEFPPSLSPQLDTPCNEQPAPLYTVALGSCRSLPI